jgi:hypothetical protein
VPSATDKYRLGRECVLSVNGQILSGIRDVTVTRTTTEIDATGFGHEMRSTVVTHRSLELTIHAIKPADVNTLRSAEAFGTHVQITTTGGQRAISKYFTVCESSTDEPLDGAADAVFTLREWGHPP